MKYMIQIFRKETHFVNKDWTIEHTYYRSEDIDLKTVLKYCGDFRKICDELRETLEDKCKWDIHLFERCTSGWNRILIPVDKTKGII